METAEQREERLKIVRERQIVRTAIEAAERSDLPAKVFNIRVFLITLNGETSITIQ